MSGRLALLLAAGGIATAAQAAPPRSLDWRQLATAPDRERLRNWRSAWMQGLAAARSSDGGALIDADPTLFDPDRALSGAMPPPGDYRCRVVKLGTAGRAGGLTAHPWGACRIAGEGEMMRLSRVDGPQRPTGLIFPGTDARAIFLGAMMFSDETRSFDYGRDSGRDIAAVIERIGHARWRLVRPYPRFESTIDIVELSPAARADRH